jgi:hypothetical protein
LRAETELTGHPAELVLHHARQVDAALRKLPPDALLAKSDRDDIRRALSVLTDGEVGGLKFKLKDSREAAKQRAWQRLKHYAVKIGDKAAERVGERLGDAVVASALAALWKALNWFAGN